MGFGIPQKLEYHEVNRPGCNGQVCVISNRPEKGLCLSDQLCWFGHTFRQTGGDEMEGS